MATPTFPLYDQILNGRLAEILARYREREMSYRKIADALEADHGVTVSHVTISRWLSGKSGAPKAKAS